MRAIVATLLISAFVLALSAGADGGQKRIPSLTFNEVSLNGERRVLSRHDIDPYTFSLSPDHKELVYIPQQCNGCAGNPVMVADVHSPRERVLAAIRPGGVWLNVSWAPNGRQTALIGAEAQHGLWLVNPDGSDLHHVADVSHFVWSPDSKSLASSRPVSVLSLESGGEQYLSQGYGPAWSPDGARIAFTHNSGLYVASVATGEVRGLTRGVGPSWSPDDRRIAFIRFVGDAYHITLWVISTRGGKPRRLARGLARFSPFLWSPKGRQIAYVRGRSLFARTLSGREGRFLARESGDITPLAWSRDGRRVLYSTLIR